jgi:HSP20 family protein
MKENDMTVMTSWDLFDDLRSAQDELARMSRMPGQRPSQFSHFGQQPGTGLTTQTWAPVIDITERKDAYLVAAELPGVGTADLEITVQDGLLTIQGERLPSGDPAEQKVHRAERRYGTFRRSITLPSHIQADKIEASAQDGVLLILVPKAVEARAKHIQVSVGKVNAKVTGAAAKNGA